MYRLRITTGGAGVLAGGERPAAVPVGQVSRVPPGPNCTARSSSCSSSGSGTGQPGCT